MYQFQFNNYFISAADDQILDVLTHITEGVCRPLKVSTITQHYLYLFPKKTSKPLSTMIFNHVNPFSL